MADGHHGWIDAARGPWRGERGRANLRDRRLRQQRQCLGRRRVLRPARPRRRLAQRGAAADRQPERWAGAGGIAAAGYRGLSYAVGGYDQDGNVLANLEIYNPRTNTWTAGPPMPTARGLLRATFADGRLYAVSGFDSTATGPFDTVEGYDPTTDQWTTEAPIPIPRAEPALATLTDGQIVAAGGCCVPGTTDNGPQGSVFLSDAELYRPWNNTWHQLPPAPGGSRQPRRRPVW
jgi:Kelch motif